MAFFPPKPEDGCADCGVTADFSTDEYADSLSPSPEDAVPLCLECYIKRHEIGFCSLVRKQLTGETAELVLGCASKKETETISKEVADEVGGEAGTVHHLTEDETVEKFGTEYIRELSRGVKSRRRNIYASASPRGTVIDFETPTTQRIRDALSEELTEYLLEVTEVRKRANIYSALTEEFPVLLEHGVLSRLGVRHQAWELAKERGVSARSERSIENQRAGKKFEEFFVEWCERHNLSLRRGKTALRRFYPEVAEEIIERTDGLSGVPDFFLRGDRQCSLEDSQWRPDGETFVEVKRGKSRLSPDQQEVIAHLKFHGFEVYTFCGEPDEHRFEKR